MTDLIPDSQIETQLGEVGIFRLSDQRRDELYTEVIHNISLSDNTTSESLQIPITETPLSIASNAQWDAVPIGSVSTACLFGGTNWKVGLCIKTENGTELYNISEVHIPIENRRVTYQHFLDMILNVIHKTGNTSVVGVSLGFEHKSVLTEYGVDAILNPASMAKGWQITDLDREVFLGRDLILRAGERGINIKSTTITNDTIAVLQNISSISSSNILPIGLVAGTGTGLSILDKDGKVKVIDIGNMIIPPDALVAEIKSRGFIRNSRLGNLGGVYAGLKFAIALERLTPVLDLSTNTLQNLSNNLYSRTDTPFIMNQLIDDPNHAYELIQKEFEIDLGDSDIDILSNVARIIFADTATFYGIAISAAINQVVRSFSDEQAILAEGSMVLNSAFIQGRTIETVKRLSGQAIRIIPVDGLTGIGTLALNKSIQAS